MIWTGDSARHDNDEEIPRTIKQVEKLNELLVTKFVEVFGKVNATDRTNEFIVPIVPTLGNNDILPHNILQPGPNRWTKSFLNIWKKFIPEEQKHGFDRGGWFFVEVIPNKLAVFSLNTLYFFSSNTAVYGCARKSEPGYEHFEWLRVQLQFIRERGMKAIISGHVPPARTQSKLSWDETCWQKYALWMQQYRDIVIGSMYGHMNIDHFMLQDFRDIDIEGMHGKDVLTPRAELDDEVTVASTADYLTDLRSAWSRLPNIKYRTSENSESRNKIEIYGRSKRRSSKRKERDHEKLLEKIGGQWGERYSATLVSASVVPNYFPALRVFEYNITGLESKSESLAFGEQRLFNPDRYMEDMGDMAPVEITRKRRFKPDPKPKRRQKPKFIIPDPPSKSSPPGPAYSPQSLTWLSYTQYFANLTTINNDFSSESADDLLPARWHNGKHSGKQPHFKVPEHHTKKFKFEVEYDTKTDKVFQLQDLTIRSFIDLAARIGRHASGPFSESEESDHMRDRSRIVTTDNAAEDQKTIGKDAAPAARLNVETENNHEKWRFPWTSKRKGKSKHGKHKKKHHHHRDKDKKKANNVWLTFLQRAFVSTRNDDDLRDDFEVS